MRTTYDIKISLLKEFIDNLEHELKYKSPPTVREVTQKGKKPNNAILQGYGSLLSSILNYGYDVANRSALPTFSKKHLHKETGLPTFVVKKKNLLRPDIIQEGRYVRPSPDHPARRSILKLLGALEYLKDKYKKDEPCVDHINTLIKDIEISIKPKGDKSKHPYQAKLGQWKLPEEIFETIFSKLPFIMVQQVCLYIARSELAILEDSIDILNGIYEKSSSDDTLVDVGEEASPDDTLVDIGEDKKEHQSFATVMLKKLKIVKKIARTIRTHESYDDTMLPVEAPVTDYPCVMFDLRLLANNYGIDYEDMKQPSDVLTTFNICIMSYFNGLVNYYSMRRYGEDYVWVQPQSSFGGLRPSFSDTAKTFRFSPGLVPDDFCEVVQEAYNALLTELKKESVFTLFKNLIDESISSIIGEYGQQVLKERTEFEARVAEKSSKQPLLYYFKLLPWTAQSAQLLALAIISSGEDSPFESFINQIQFLEKKSSKLPQIKEILGQRNRNFKIAFDKILNNSEKRKAIAPNELMGMLEELIEKAFEECNENINPTAFYTLDDFEKTVDSQILDIIDNSLIRSDYSEVASTYEHLVRLMEIKNLLGSIRRREQKYRKKRKQERNKTSFDRHLDSLRQISRLRIGNRARKHSTKSTDTLMSEYSTPSELSFPTRNGMDASCIPVAILAKSIARQNIIRCETNNRRAKRSTIISDIKSFSEQSNKAGKEGKANKVTVSMSECYFEFTTPIFDHIAEEMHKGANKVFNYQDWYSGITGSVGELHFIDIAQLPRHPINTRNSRSISKTVKSKWKEEWSEIPDEELPAILVIDNTSATNADIIHQEEQYSKKPSDQKPYIVITFESGNKVSQPVSLVSMGKWKVLKWDYQERNNKIPFEYKRHYDALIKYQKETKPHRNGRRVACQRLWRSLNQYRSAKSHTKQSLSLGSRNTFAQTFFPNLLGKQKRRFIRNLRLKKGKQATMAKRIPFAPITVSKNHNEGLSTKLMPLDKGNRNKKKNQHLRSRENSKNHKENVLGTSHQGDWNRASFWEAPFIIVGRDLSTYSPKRKSHSPKTREAEWISVETRLVPDITSN